MNVHKTEWLPIKGFEGIYEVSNTGEVKSVARYKTRGRYSRWNDEKVLKPSKDKRGYLRVTLHSESGEKHYVSVHRLVADAFIPNPENKPTVNHINGCKWVNFYLNLEWSTHKEQIEHADETGLRKAYGEHTKKSKLGNLAVLHIRTSGLTQDALAKHYNVHKSCIYKIIKRQTWKHV